MRRSRAVPTAIATAVLLALGAAPAIAAEADETGAAQPEAVIMTRVCEQNGALVSMSNFGGGSVAFTVLVDNEASGSYTVTAGAQAQHLVPIMEDQTVAIQVTADGMAPVAATRTRDCEGAPAVEPTEPAGATDPVDVVPADTAAPQVVPPTAVAGASDSPTSEGTDSTTAPATDPEAPAGTLPFTGPAHVGLVALLGVLLVAAGVMLLVRPRRILRRAD